MKRTACWHIASKTIFCSLLIHRLNFAICRSTKTARHCRGTFRAPRIRSLWPGWLPSRVIITIPMSFNPQHIRENFESVNIELTREEFNTLSGLW